MFSVMFMCIMCMNDVHKIMSMLYLIFLYWYFNVCDENADGGFCGFIGCHYRVCIALKCIVSP